MRAYADGWMRWWLGFGVRLDERDSGIWDESATARREEEMSMHGMGAD